MSKCSLLLIKILAFVNIILSNCHNKCMINTYIVLKEIIFLYLFNKEKLKKKNFKPHI